MLFCKAVFDFSLGRERGRDGKFILFFGFFDVVYKHYNISFFERKRFILLFVGADICFFVCHLLGSLQLKCVNA